MEHSSPSEVKNSFWRKYDKMMSAFDFSLGYLLNLTCLEANPLTSLGCIFLVSVIGIIIPAFAELPRLTAGNYWAGFLSVWLHKHWFCPCIVLSLWSSHMKQNVPSAAKQQGLAIMHNSVEELLDGLTLDDRTWCQSGLHEEQGCSVQFKTSLS